MSLNGWLEKRSIFGIWLKKYFSLKQNKLLIYKNASVSNAEKEYQLDSLTIVEPSETTKCVFKVTIQTPNIVILTLRASTIDEMIKWVSQIRRSAFENKALYISMFNVISVIARGSSCKITLCEKKGTHEIVAIKSVKKEKLLDSSKSNNNILNEKDILTSINNPFMINLKYAFQNSKYYYLALEYAPGGDLYHRLKNVKIPLFDIKLYIAELTIAIHELHTNHIIYRDMKPENILIAKDGHLKLADFGLSTFCEPNQRKKTFCGTTEYIAPEVILNEGYGQEIDWWGIGILTYELLYGSTPFTGMNSQYIYQSILKRQPIFPKNEDQKVVSFISTLLEKDPEKRGGYNFIVGSEFMSDIDFYAVYKKKISPSFIPNTIDIKDTKGKVRDSDYCIEYNSAILSDNNFYFNCTQNSI